MTAFASQAKRQYEVLDSFRGLCACLVAMSHFNANSVFTGTPIFESGAVYVDFFFVLSGFVIFANYQEKLRNGFGLGKFIFLRFARLYPLHLFVLSAFIAIDLLQMVVSAPGMALYKPFSAPGEGPWDIAANLLLIQSLHVSKHLAFNGPAWSISTEFYTYILFGLVMVFARKNVYAVAAFLGLAGAVVVYCAKGELYAKLDFGFFRCIYGFAAGALTWWLFNITRGVNASVSFSNPERIKTADTIIELAALIACLTYIAVFSQSGAGSMAAPIVFSVVIWLFASEKGKISAFLKKPVFLFLGVLSYSIYMTHIFISGKFFEFSVRLLESRDIIDFTIKNADGVSLYGKSIVIGTAFEVFYLCVVVFCSWLTYRWVESPCREWSRAIVKRQSVRAPRETVL